MDLRRGFESPPSSARPRAWCYWMNVNITKVGIALHLEWIHRVGIGGFQDSSTPLGTPKVLDKRPVSMTPEWKNVFLFATHKADEIGLGMAIDGSSGWSKSTNPRVRPNHAMKKIVWSETLVEARKPFQGVLSALMREEPGTIRKVGE